MNACAFPPRRWLPAVALVAVFTVALVAATPGSSEERLRALIRLPRMDAFGGVLGYDASAGYAFIWSVTPPTSELKALRKDLPAGIEGATRLREIGQLHLQYRAYDRANAALAESLRQLRALGAPQTASAAVLADYARTLMMAGQTEEALREARRAVELAPADWRTLATLGRCLTASAIAEVAPPGASAAETAARVAALSASGAWKVEPAKAEKSRSLSAEAVKVADRAVSLAEKEASVRLDRVVVRGLARLIDLILEASSGTEATPARISQAIFPAELAGDLAKAAELDRDNPRLLGTAAMTALMTAAAERGLSNLEALMTSGAWKLLDEAARNQLRASLSRLEDLSANGDPAKAAAALDVLGVLHLIGTQDLTAAEKSFREALRKDPDRDSAWDGLVFVLISSDRWAEMAALCEARVQERDSARARLLVAKAYERLRNFAKVVEVLEPAQRRYPDDFLLNLATAMALLHESSDDPVLARAAQLISRAEKLAGESPSAEQAVNLLIGRGVLLALLGQPDAARAHLQRVLEIDASRDDIREILKLIE